MASTSYLVNRRERGGAFNLSPFFFFRHSWCEDVTLMRNQQVAGFNFAWKKNKRLFAVRCVGNIKKQIRKKIRFAQHCILIADKGNHHLLQTVAPSNQGKAACLSPKCP